MEQYSSRAPKYRHLPISRLCLAVGWRTLLVSYHIGFSIQRFNESKKAKESQKNNNSKITIFWNLIIEMTSYLIYHILLVRSKSQIWSSTRERGLYKDLTTRGQGSLRAILEVCLPHIIHLNTCWNIKILILQK